MQSLDQRSEACVLCLKRNAARRGTAKAVGSHFCVSNAQQQNVSVEDCAKSEIRVGWAPSIADRDRTGCTIILSYRRASPLSPFVSFIVQGAAALFAPALLLLLSPLPLLLLLHIAVADADRPLLIRTRVLRLAQLLLLLLTMLLLQLRLLHLPSPPSHPPLSQLLLLLLLLKSDTRF